MEMFCGFLVGKFIGFQQNQITYFKILSETVRKQQVVKNGIPRSWIFTIPKIFGCVIP